MKNNTKSTQPPFSILNILHKNQLIQTPSPSYEYELYHVANKKICIEAYKTFVPKTRLFTNLEIYEWRNLTQFPISKSKYVSIHPSINQSPKQQGIELLVYIQHCPLKLNRIYEMTLAQTIYMLKESYIGFERLYNRFGPFQITQSMIAINQKGYCKVWINQNYATNVILKPTLNEENMIFMIQAVMQSHCQQSKASRKLFKKLKYCKNFLSAIIEIDCFSVASKLLVPTRFVLSVSSCKEVSGRLDTLNHQDKWFKTESLSQQNIRYSIFSSNYKTNHNDGKQQSIYDLQISKTRLHENQIKRFKSLSKIKAANIMKISDGETAYTRNHNTKTSNLGGFHNSPRQTANGKTLRDLSKKKVMRKWLEDSTFIMEIEDKGNEKKQDKQKKQMSYSTSLINKPEGYSLKNRKLSANMSNQKPENSFYKFQNQNPTKKSQHNDLNYQFSLVMDDEEKDNSACNPTIRIIQYDEQKYKQEHTQNILKNNGWHLTNNFLNTPKQLNQSFHEGGHQQNYFLKQIKLDKLDSIGRRPVAMSVLPEQYEDII